MSSHANWTKRAPSSPLPWLVLLLLAAATLLAYWPVFHCLFLNFDDPDYVTDNWVVQRGLTLHGLAWAFITSHAANWHPLTWLSHMLDCQLFGLSPAAHHATNLLFHTLNSLLLFGLLKRMTGALWRSALVAALFALHPIHVESVAWISERKDVLSTFFGLLTLWAYVRYVEQSKVQSPKSKAAGGPAAHLASRFPFHVSRFYLLSLLLFACSLMSKPMLVTLPFLLLLFDYWPLNRFQKTQVPLRSPPLILHPSSFILLEKLPFLALSAASSIVTLVVQREAGAISELSTLPVGARLANASVSYVRYIGKILWPDNLAVCYPLVRWGHWQIIGACLFVLVISLLALWAAPRRPYLAVGWLWFLGALVPVIGVVQVGAQSMADRYGYIPSIGLFIALSWGAHDLLGRWRVSPLVLGSASAGILLACAWLTAGQLRYWQDSVSLFTRSLAVAGDNALGHIKLGESLMQQHKFAEAKAHFLSALQTSAQTASAHYQLGVLLQAQGQPAEAITHWRIALQLEPTWLPVVNNLAWTLAICRDPACRNPADAVRLAEQASAADPGNFSFFDTLGAAYAAVGRYAEAAQADRTAIALAEEVGQTNAAARFRQRLELYQHQKPYRAE